MMSPTRTAWLKPYASSITFPKPRASLFVGTPPPRIAEFSSRVGDSMHGCEIAFGFTLSTPREKLSKDGRLRRTLRAWLRPRRCEEAGLHPTYKRLGLGGLW